MHSGSNQISNKDFFLHTQDFHAINSYKNVLVGK